jgi:sRNA-binding protein
MNSKDPNTLPLRPNTISELQIGDSVSVSIPWPSGPEGMTASVTEIDGDDVILEAVLGSGWKVVVEAERSDIIRGRYTDMWVLEG